MPFQSHYEPANPQFSGTWNAELGWPMASPHLHWHCSSWEDPRVPVSESRCWMKLPVYRWRNSNLLSFSPYGVVVVCFASQLLLITQLFPFSFWQFHRHRDIHTHTYLSEVSYLRVLKHLSQFLTFLTSHSYSVYELVNNSYHRRRRNGFLCTHWGKVNFKFWNEIRYEKVAFSPKIVHDILDFQFFFFASLY